MNKMKKRFLQIIAIVFTFIFILLGFSIIWCLTTWTRLSMDELVFELAAPMRGVGSDMLSNFFLKCFAPAAIVTALVVILSRVKSIKIKEKIPVRSKYSLEMFSYKEIDQFLWLVGKNISWDE